MDARTQRKDRKQTIIVLGKDEMNLTEFPIARLGRRDTRMVIEYHGQIVKDGRTETQHWTVSGDGKLGLPTEFAERVLVALISISAEDGFTSKKVTFSRYRILKMMGLSLSQRNYNALRTALRQLAGVTIYSEGSWWDKETQRRITTEEAFHLIEKLYIRTARRKSKEIDDDGTYGFVVWGDTIWQSFKAGYIKRLNLPFYYGLSNALARRLYRFLDKRMYYQDSYQIDIFDLAARLGMVQYPKPSKVKQKLQPAFNLLIEAGFLHSAEAVKMGKFTRIHFRKTEPAYVQNGLFSPSESAEDASEADTASEMAIAPQEVLYDQYDTPEALQQVWAAILDDFQRSNQASYDMLIGSGLLRIEDGTATIAVNIRCHEWVANRMRRQLVTALTIASGEQVTEICLVALETVE